jgi:hypothetical protein
MPPTNLDGKTERKSSGKNNFMWHDSFKDPCFHKTLTVVGMVICINHTVDQHILLVENDHGCSKHRYYRGIEEARN